MRPVRDFSKVVGVASVFVVWISLCVPRSGLALIDATGHRAQNNRGVELQRSVTSDHFEVFYNTATDDPPEGVTLLEAEDAASFAECAWTFFMDPPLSDAFAFRWLRDLNHLNMDFDEEVLKIPVWIRAPVCDDCTNCSPECLSSTHGGSPAPRMDLSPLGPVFGCTESVCGVSKTDNCCDETYWGRTGTGYSGVILHEFAHVLFKGYNRFFNGGALQFLNEGLTSGIMTVPLSTFHESSNPRSVRNADLDAHLDLSDRSLREPGDNYYRAPVFWYYLATEYTNIVDNSAYSRDDLSSACREYATAIGVRHPSGLLKMNRVPGRDVIYHLQEALAACHPLGLGTPGCYDAATDTYPLEVRCATYAADGTVLDAGCIPRYDPDWATHWMRSWDPADAVGEKEFLDRTGEVFMPRLMEIIDDVLITRHSMVPDGLPHRAFRKYLEWNYLKDPQDESFADGGPSDPYPFRVKAFGVHYHDFDLTGGEWRLHLEKDADLPTMASAVFFLSGDALVEFRGWSTAASRDILIPSEYERAVLIVTAFEGTYDPEGRAPFADSGGHYQLTTEQLAFAPDVFDDGQASTPAPGGWPTARNDTPAAATPLVLPDTPDERETGLRYEYLNLDTLADRDFFRVQLPNADGACCCPPPLAACPKKVVISVRPENEVDLDIFLYSPSSALPLDPQTHGWATWSGRGAEIEIACPESVEVAVPGDSTAPLLNADRELLFSIDRTTARTAYDLDIRYEYTDCAGAGINPDLIYVFDWMGLEPEYSIFPDDRMVFMDCLGNPMCDPAEEYMAVLWNGGDFRLDFVFETPIVSQGLFSVALTDPGGTVLAQAAVLDYDLLFKSNPARPMSVAAVTPTLQQTVAPGAKGIGILYAQNLPKGWYLIRLDAAYQTFYGFQLGGQDADQDQIPDIIDNCPKQANIFQTDTDHDGIGDVCDTCPVHFNPSQTDEDGDGFGDACEKIAPISTVTANDSATPLFITSQDPLSVEIACYAGVNAGQTMDWWVVAASPFGFISLNLGQGTEAVGIPRWVPGLSVTYQGPLVDIAPFELFNLSGLPFGTYAVFFGLDTEVNGELDMDKLVYDYVFINVVPEVDPGWTPDVGNIDDGSWVE